MRSAAFPVCLCLLGFAVNAFAQRELALDFLSSSVGTAASTPVVLHRQVAEVAVQLVVTDRSGNPVTELLPDELQVLDGGVPASITELRREDKLPLRVALVIDWSDSVQNNLAFERMVAMDFLRNVLRPETDQAMVIGFRYRVDITQPLTRDLPNLEAGLRPVAGVPLSSVYDALVAAADALKDVDPDIAQRRAIVLLSDGVDNVSAHGLPDVIQAAQRANVSIYTISTPPRRMMGRGCDVVMELARVTGGQAFFLSRTAVPAALSAIRQELSAGYTLYFKPGLGSGGHLRSLEITAKNKNLQVRARRSYYIGGD